MAMVAIAYKRIYMSNQKYTGKLAKEPSPCPPEVAPFHRLTLSVKAAAEATGLSRSGLYKAMTEGKLAWLKVGSRRLIEVSALQEFIKGGM